MKPEDKVLQSWRLPQTRVQMIQSLSQQGYPVLFVSVQRMVRDGVQALVLLLWERRNIVPSEKAYSARRLSGLAMKQAQKVIVGEPAHLRPSQLPLVLPRC